MGWGGGVTGVDGYDACGAEREEYQVFRAVL